MLQINDIPARVRVVAVKPVITATCLPSAAGITVTASRGSTTLTGTTDASGYVEIPVNSLGRWTVSAVVSGEELSADVTVSGVGAFPVELFATMIYGVTWDGSSSTVLSRTDAAALFSDPVAAVGTGVGASPFDSLYPWCDMEEYNVINGEIAYKRGESGFSRTAYDTVVKIPEFWYQRPDANTFRIAEKATSGFEKHPGSGLYVGRYWSDSAYASKSGKPPVNNISRATARTGAGTKGAAWHNLDIATYSAIQWLYLVEYADWNSQAKIGKGVVSLKAPLSSGGTDSMLYHTGRAGGTDGEVSNQYRHIENPYSNMIAYLDGSNISGTSMLVSTNRSKYADSDSYTDAGVAIQKGSSSLYPTSLIKSDIFPWFIIPNGSGGSATSYIPDRYWFNTTGTVPSTDGRYDSGNYAGFFALLALYAEGGAGSGYSARNIFAPYA